MNHITIGQIIAAFERVKKEPAVLIGLAGSVLMVVVGSADWKAAVPGVMGVLTRFFVSPAA